MAHSNTVADRNCVELKRRSARLADGIFDSQSNLIEVDMPRHYLTETIGNTDEWFVDVGIAKTAGVEQAAMRRSLKTFFYRITSHKLVLQKQLKGQ
jgi:hypothetical protein